MAEYVDENWDQKWLFANQRLMQNIAISKANSKLSFGPILLGLTH